MSAWRIALLQEERYLPSYHGSNKSSRLLLEALASLGHRCRALCPLRRPETTLEELRRDLAARGIELTEREANHWSYHHCGVEVTGLPRDVDERHGFVVEHLSAFDPDIVAVSADPRHYLLAAALEAAPERVIFVVHSHEHVPFGPLSRRHDPEQQERLHRVRAVIAVSRHSQAYLREHGGLEARLLHFPAYGDGPFALRGGHESGNTRDWITLINPDETKGGRLFLELARAFPHQTFATVRWGASEEIVSELARCANVRLLEPVDDIDAVLRHTRVLLMPSHLPETFGLAAVEAMLRGIPVLASQLGGLPEATLGAATLLPACQAIAHGGGYEIPPTDPAPWAEALAALLSEPSRYAEASARVRAAAGRFVSELSTRPFETLFREVAGETDRAPVAVVDPFDAAFLLAQELVDRAYPVVGIESSAEVAPQILAQCDRSILRSMLRHDGDVAATAAALAARGVSVVLPGCEPGVPLADALAEALGSRGNSTALSRARRDKFLMAERARLAGVAVPRQCCSSSWPEIAAWARALGRWPVVAKPPHSLASEDVYVCRHEAELEHTFRRILDRRNLSGWRNETVLVQELLDGTQFVVDTLSRDGEPYLSAIWRYGRPAFAGDLLRWARGESAWPEELAHLGWEEIQYASVGNDAKLILPGDDARARTLFAYAARVLEALEIRQGPAHFEIMWVDDGPRLVEVGARLHGAPNTHWMCGITTGLSQLDGLIDLYLEPERFARHERREYRLRWPGANVRLHPWRAGHFRGFRDLARIERLPSFRRFWYLSAPREIAALDCLGVVALMHADAEVVERDFAAIRALEREDLFELEPVAPLVEHA